MPRNPETQREWRKALVGLVCVAHSCLAFHASDIGYIFVRTACSVSDQSYVPAVCKNWASAWSNIYCCLGYMFNRTASAGSDTNGMLELGLCQVKYI